MINRPRIEICGNIASGKTTLATQLQTNDSVIIFEDFQNNPFYDSFYRNPLAYSFETELTFLLQHYHDIKEQRQSPSNIICDYSLLLDMAYADVNLTGNKHSIFFEVIEEVLNEIGQPESIIYLKCSENVLLNRIRERSREAEVMITIDYLKELSKAIHERIELILPVTRVLTIDSDQIDFRTSIEGIPELRSL